MSLSNQPTVQDVLLQSAEGAAASASATASSAVATSNQLPPYPSRTDYPNHYLYGCACKQWRNKKELSDLGLLNKPWPQKSAPPKKGKAAVPKHVPQPLTIKLRKRDHVVYAETYDEDDSGDVSTSERPAKKAKKEEDEDDYDESEIESDDEEEEDPRPDKKKGSDKKKSKTKSAPKKKSSSTKYTKKSAGRSATKRKPRSKAANDAAIQRQQMFRLPSGQVIHSSDLTKEQALENLSILGQVQMLAFAKKHDVGQICPEKFRHGLGPTDRMRKNISLFLTGKEYTPFKRNQSTFMKNRHANGLFDGKGAVGVKVSANKVVGGPQLQRVLGLDPSKLPIRIVPYEEDGVPVKDASGAELSLLAIMPSNGKVCSSVVLMKAAKMELTLDWKKKVDDPKKSTVDMNTAATGFLHKRLLNWCLEKHPKTLTGKSGVPGWEHKMRLYIIPASAVGSGKTTVYGSDHEARKAIRKMAALK